MTIDIYHVAMKEHETTLESRFQQDLEGATVAEVWEDRVLTTYRASEGAIAEAVMKRFLDFENFFRPGGIMEGNIVLSKSGGQILYMFVPRDATVTRHSEVN